MENRQKYFNKKILKLKIENSRNFLFRFITPFRNKYSFSENETNKNFHKKIKKDIINTTNQIYIEGNDKKFKEMISHLMNEISALKLKINLLEPKNGINPHHLENEIIELKRKQQCFETALKVKITRKTAENTFKSSNVPNLYYFFHRIYITLEGMMISLKAIAGGLADTNYTGKLSDAGKIINFLKLIIGSIPFLGSAIQNILEFSNDLMKYIDIQWHNNAIKSISENIGGAYEFKPEILNIAIQLTERYQNQISQLKSEKDVNKLADYASTQILGSLLDGNLDFKSNLTEQWLINLTKNSKKIKKISLYFHKIFSKKIKIKNGTLWSVNEVFYMPDLLLNEGARYGISEKQMSKYGYRYGYESEINEHKLVFQGKHDISSRISIDSTLLTIDSFNPEIYTIKKKDLSEALEKLDKKCKKLKKVNKQLIKENKELRKSIEDQYKFLEKRLSLLEKTNELNISKKDNEHLFFQTTR